MDRTKGVIDLCSLLAPSAFKKNLNVAIDKIDWAEVVEVANLNLLTPALFYSLKEKNLLGASRDPKLAGFLEEIYRRNRARNEGILAQLQEIDGYLSRYSISPLILKGSAVLSEDLYPDIGIRVMSDIDIMFRPEEFKEAHSALEELGYIEFGRDLRRWHHHTPRMRKEGTLAAIEPHFRIIFDKEIEYIPYNETTSKRSENEVLKNAYVLKPTWHLYHTFLHTAVVDKNHRLWRLGLRHLYDFVIVAASYGDRVDWQELYALARKYEHENILEDYLYMAYRLFGLRTPLKFNGARGWLHLKKVIWQSKLVPDTRIYNLHRAYTEFSEIYSYEALKSYYGLHSKSQYPAALIRYIFYHIRKHLF